MYKTAIIFNGLPRLRDASDQHWLSFIEKTHADVFVHTWQSDNLVEIDRMQSIYKPVASQIDTPIQVNETPYIPRLYPGLNVGNIFSMWTSIQRGFWLMQRYYENQGLVPDLIVRTRFDLLIEGFSPEIGQPLVIPMDPLKRPTCFHYHRKFLVPQTDVLVYGTMQHMEKYCNTINLLNGILDYSDITFTSENILAASLSDQRVPFINDMNQLNIIRN